MAKLLRLADVTRTTTYNLLSGALRMKGGSRAASRDGELVTETMELFGEGTNSVLTGAQNDIDDFEDGIERFFADPLNPSSQWLEENVDGESTRRALLYTLSCDPISFEPLLNSRLLGKGIANTILTLTRSRLWESATSTPVSTTAVSCWGGKWTLTGIGGNRFARTSNAHFGANGSSGPVYRLWAGLREKRLGTSGFNAVIELEDGSAGTDTALASEVGASPSGSSTNNKFRCTFATDESMVYRCSVALSAGGRTPSHYIGKYKVLLRCKLSSSPATEVAVQLYYGNTNTPAANFASLPRVYVNNTSWDLVEIGTLQMPPDGYRNGDPTTVLDNFLFRIYAELVTGTGGSSWIDFDAIELMPAEHLFYAEGAAIQITSFDHPVEALTRENGDQLARGYTGTTPDYSIAAAFTDWWLPNGDGMLVLAGTRDGSHDLSDALNVSLTYFERWRNYRS